MILPFVREIFADLEHSSAFERVPRHLSLGSGRRIVSGLTATARSLYIPLIARAARHPVIVVVADNKAAEALEPMLRAGCEFTGAIDPARVVVFPPTTCSRSRISRRIPTCRSSVQWHCGRCLSRLPYWFTVSTPIGQYNPDWAIVMDDPEARRESHSLPGARDQGNGTPLRPTSAEGREITLQKADFQGALGVSYRVVTTAAELP